MRRGRIGKAVAFCLELGDRLLGELLALLQDNSAGLGGDVGIGVLIGHGGDFVRDRSLDLAVRRLDEAVLIDAAIGRQRADQADVRTFRSLDWADAAVVAVVDVADVEAGALAAQATGAQRRQAALAGQLGQRVGLVHELAELAAAEELLHRRHDGADVDEGVRRGLLGLLDRHALADDPLHAEQTDAERVLDQLADGADAAVAEVVDVVGDAEPVVELDQVADDRGDVFAG